MSRQNTAVRRSHPSVRAVRMHLPRGLEPGQEILYHPNFESVTTQWPQAERNTFAIRMNAGDHVFSSIENFFGLAAGIRAST